MDFIDIFGTAWITKKRNIMNKKICAIFIAIVCTVSVQAQFTIGVRAGFNLTNILEKEDGKKVNRYEFKPGFQIGAVGDYAINENFSIQSGILFATQGARWKFERTEVGAELIFTETTNLNYLQIPINAQCRLNLGKAQLMLQVGTYLGYAISGTIKLEQIRHGGELEKGKGKIPFGWWQKPYYRNVFDFGLGSGIGVQFYNFQIGVGYNLGLANLYGFDKRTEKNMGFALTATYLFKR